MKKTYKLSNLQALQAFAGDFILNIKDITDFVKEQYTVLQTKGANALVLPRERVYVPSCDKTCTDMEIDFFKFCF